MGGSWMFVSDCFHQLACVIYLLACVILLGQLPVSACLCPHQDWELSVPGLEVSFLPSLDVLSLKVLSHEPLSLCQLHFGLCQLACVSLLASACLRHVPFNFCQVVCIS